MVESMAKLELELELETERPEAELPESAHSSLTLVLLAMDIDLSMMNWAGWLESRVGLRLSGLLENDMSVERTPRELEIPKDE